MAELATRFAPGGNVGDTFDGKTIVRVINAAAGEYVRVDTVVEYASANSVDMSLTTAWQVVPVDVAAGVGLYGIQITLLSEGADAYHYMLGVDVNAGADFGIALAANSAYAPASITAGVLTITTPVAAIGNIEYQVNRGNGRHELRTVTGGGNIRLTVTKFT